MTTKMICIDICAYAVLSNLHPLVLREAFINHKS